MINSYMVHRNKDLANPPIELVDVKWNALRATLLVEGNLHDAISACYRDCTIDALAILYENKCAICERDRGEELEVDHYRPKKARAYAADPHYNQPGYYWLSYEWSNLIPLCSKCNNIKRDRFPITGWAAGSRVDFTNSNGYMPFHPYDRNWLQLTEQPLIVNPEYDTSPERHFIHNANGMVRGQTPEGEETIRVCGLNRKDLVRLRRKVIEKYANSIRRAFDKFGASGNATALRSALAMTFFDILDGCDTSSQFSLLHIHINNYFQYFIDNKLPINLRGQAHKYFKEFKRKNGFQ